MSSKQPRQAIALSYDGQQAPTLTAKGEDELAEAILALAREHEVPIYENAELVRLLARLELDEQIPEALYLTIAEIIAFAWQLRGRVPAGFTDDTAQPRDVSPTLLRLPCGGSVT
ncbi:EscU/YscU/HrcU family type III secretion system export apparatus switch protein [Pseudomonas putida]|uniref:Flagellar biosynthetic protein FlhB n=1 Tax=Pseudomonas putida TaxID=303 RepID=A0A7W2KXG7_PSEPU|nr:MULTISPECIES: EscU/YscU/HrcU family type III secretion system export apparatus switch protein [Pseudomonas]MBA6114603.1 EscU/YscU/HrcU family type III secretion system export apparatus switch protein [Pseudomonas putida]MBI6941244.1 EscU/YscU/HrcU family type III secretion system export apparatus switch protein [Pseudomonas putida]MBI6957615.1 EscU/YscU/HrcU family type III secretion system export apparatus switch protein [Pseudomonas putida]MCZ9638836.1 EscU/YscU/HrcU family type III secret